MNEPIENDYFNWLCAKVKEIGNPNYDDLLRILHGTEFVWVVPADRHRAADGVELRTDYFKARFKKKDPWLLEQPCSIFEVLIAMAKRAEFQTDIPFKDWFWEMISNLRLDEFRRVHASDIDQIEDILYTFVWRQYDPSGVGGLFPLSSTQNDQRKIEIWYQFFEYLRDRGLMI